MNYLLLLLKHKTITKIYLCNPAFKHRQIIKLNKKGVQLLKRRTRLHETLIKHLSNRRIISVEQSALTQIPISCLVGLLSKNLQLSQRQSLTAILLNSSKSQSITVVQTLALKNSPPSFPRSTKLLLQDSI